MEKALTRIESEDTEGKYLTFFIADQLFAVPVANVVQIVGLQKITEIPEYPVYAKGIVNFRGSVMPVIDIRLRLGKPEAEYTDRTCIIVSNIRERDFGFIVDGVDGVTDISNERISPPPEIDGGMSSQYLSGVAELEDNAENMILLMDAERILGKDTYSLPGQTV